MIPETLLDQLIATTRTTIGEVKARIDASGGGESTAHQVKHTALNNLTTDSGFTLLGSGAGRAAVTHPAFDGHVVKIAIYSPREKEGFSVDGVSQNKREAWTWDHLPTELQSRFTPVEKILADGRLLVMPVVTTDHEEIPYDDALKFTEETNTALHHHNWTAIGLDVNSVGKRNEQLEMFDYGLPVKPTDQLPDTQRIE